MLIKIKPMSVNDAWQGRRYKTNNYKVYEEEILYMLPKKMDIPEGKLFIRIEFGFSSEGSDWDNPIKLFVDILGKKYGFNDNRIYEGRVLKTIVEKGDEFIDFHLMPYKAAYEL